MNTALVLLSLIFTIPAHAQNQCTDVSGIYDYQSMTSQCTMKYAVSPNRYYEGQDAVVNWPCQLSWIDAPGAGDKFVIKNNSKIIVEQSACDSVKLTLESVSGKKFSCEIKGQSSCIGSDFAVSSTLPRQACTNSIPNNLPKYSGLFIAKCESRLCFSTYQIEHNQITPWLGDQKQKLIQCGFPSSEL
jgi:hypothetical protein